jgi:predicted transcriptional regulator
MLMHRRSTDQIIADILEICLMPGVIKTKIVYQANMNFDTINPYLDMLIKDGLIRATSSKHPIYRTTRKGKMALKALRAIEEIIPERSD